MNDGKNTTRTHDVQAHHARAERPFLATLVCVAQLKLLLRLDRASAPSWHERRCIDKLIDGASFIGLSLESLRRPESEMSEIPVESVGIGSDPTRAGALQ
jgi:hypothetical protein